MYFNQWTETKWVIAVAMSQYISLIMEGKTESKLISFNSEVSETNGKGELNWKLITFTTLFQSIKRNLILIMEWSGAHATNEMK